MFVVSIADADGHIVASNPATAEHSAAGERYFQFHRERDSGQPFVAETMRHAGRPDWHMHFTRRLNGPGGAFAGVVILEVDPAYFTSGYERSRQGDLGLLAVVGADGMMRAARVGERASWGQRVDLAAWTQPPAQPWAVRSAPSPPFRSRRR